MAGIGDLIGLGIRGAVRIKTHNNRNDVVEALDIASVAMGKLEAGPEGMSLGYLPKETNKGDFKYCVSTTDWLKAVDIDILESPHKSIIFSKAVDTSKGIFVTDGDIVGALAKREDGIDRSVYILDLNATSKYANLLFELLFLVNNKNGKRLNSNRATLVTLPSLEYSSKPEALQYKTMITVMRELHSLDSRDPTRALKLYAEKHYNAQ